MSEVRWERYPRVALTEHARAWLALQANLGRAGNTVEAYGRGLERSVAAIHTWRTQLTAEILG